MIWTIIEWSSTLLIVLGLLYLSSKKAGNPNIRLVGFIFTSIGCFLMAVFGLFLGSYGVFATNIGCCLVNLNGFRNCYKEIKVGK